MKMQGSIIVITAVVALILGIFITTVDVCYEPAPSDRDSDLLTSELSCDVCPNTSNLYHLIVQKGSKELYMFVDVLSYNTCCNVIANTTRYLTDIRVNYCLNLSSDGNHIYIELTSYVLIKTLVGVENITEGCSLSLQDKNEADTSHYRMLFEPLNVTYPLVDVYNFALAFVPPNNATEKYYVLPKEESEEDRVLLTLHKNPGPSVDKYVFQVKKTIID